MRKLLTHLFQLLCASSLALMVLLAACTPMTDGTRSVGKKVEEKAPWVNALQNEVSALGANNWIVISESAYPTPNHTGLRVIVADAGLPEVVSEVMEAIESEGHIWPKIYTIREFDHLSEDYAPEVEKFKASREAAFAARKKQVLTKRSLDTLLESAMKDYRVLLVKSSSAFPYSSVFMELDSGYWNGTSEDALRKKMRQ